jgi:ferredoxin
MARLPSAGDCRPGGRHSERPSDPLSHVLDRARFYPEEVGEPVRQGAFEVERAASGMTLTVPPEKSILAVVEEAGVSVESSCQEGTCGTCETPVLEGGSTTATRSARRTSRRRGSDR